MQAQTAAQTQSIALPDTQDEDYDLCRLGVELEYPIAGDAFPAPAGQAHYSDSLYDSRGPHQWEHGGRFHGEHTGTEISSSLFDLHSSEPEEWYRASIASLENAGYPFAATGSGDTNFGLHNHISNLTGDEADVIREQTSNEWARVFWCSSINPRSADPWRHGGVRDPAEPFSSFDPRRAGDGPPEADGYHWEFRLPEPVLPAHFGLTVDYWRILARDGPEAAGDFARELVYDKDERLTAIQQYKILREEIEDWPDMSAMSNDLTDRTMAIWMRDLME